MGFTNIKESTIETFALGTYNITLYAEFAGYHLLNELSWYVVGTAEYNLLFSGLEGNFGYADPPIVKSFTANSTFGLSFLSPEARYFTETIKNPDGVKHAEIYINLDDPDVYLIGFENMLGGGDGDYNDMVISLKLIAPRTRTVVNVGGYEWYYWNASSDRVAIVLFGGTVWIFRVCYALTSSLYTTSEYSVPKELFIRDLCENGIDVLSVKYDMHRNQSNFVYDGWNYTWLSDAAAWLASNGYNFIYLFGFSAGAIVVAYEIQKDYASASFSAAVFASAPVNYTDPGTGQDIYGLMRSAQNASKVKICASLIAGENDMLVGNITAQMRLYYDNMLIHKEWHTWIDGHDVFWNTCKDHLGETVSNVSYNWYQQHPHCLLTVRAKIGSSELSNIKVWIDEDSERLSPVSVNVTRGNHTVKVESSFIRYPAKYTFIYWENGATENPRTINIVDDMNITAYYNATYLCPILYVWNGTHYVEEGALDIRSPEGVDKIVNHTLTNSPALTQNQKYRLKLVESPYNQSQSFIDNVKFYIIDEDGVWHQSNLASATHSDSGNVKVELLYSDDNRVHILPQQEILLEFTKVNVNEDEIIGFVFVIEAYNPKPQPG